MLCRHSFHWNLKRVYWAYCLLMMYLWCKGKKHLPSYNQQLLSVPPYAKVCRPIDYMHDTFASDQRFMTYMVLDYFSVSA